MLLMLVAIAVLVLLAVASVGGRGLSAVQSRRLAASNGGTQGNIVRGYFWSILFMLSMPFVIFGSLCTLMYLEIRKARRKLAARQALVATDSAPAMADDASRSSRLVETTAAETAKVRRRSFLALCWARCALPQLILGTDALSALLPCRHCCELLVRATRRARRSARARDVRILLGPVGIPLFV